MQLKTQYFQLIAEAGFDTIRVPIRWTSYATDTPPYTVEEAFFQYEPFAFTHQGAGWVGEPYWTIGVEWPSPPKTPLVPKLAAQQDPFVRQWFHDYNTRPAESNPCSPGEIAKQLDVAAEARGFPWAYWEFGDSFGVYDQVLEEWRRGLLQALIPPD